MNNNKKTAGLILMLLLADSFIVVFSVVISYVIRIIIVDKRSIETVWERLSWLTIVVIVIHLVTLWMVGQYNFQRLFDKIRSFYSVLLATVAAYFIMTIVFYLFPEDRIGRIVFTTHVPITAIGLYLLRLSIWGLIIEKTSEERVLIIGDCRKIAPLLSELEHINYPKIRIVGFFEQEADQNEPVLESDLLTNEQKNTPPFFISVRQDNIEDAIKENNINRVLVIPEAQLSDSFQTKMIDLKYSGLPVVDFAAFYSQLLGKLPLEILVHRWFVYSDRTDYFQTQFFTRTKRIVDVILSAIGLILSVPILVIASIAIKINSPSGSVLFRQIRLSKDKEPFTILKFRTMIPDAEKETGPRWASQNEDKIFFIGKILRKLRLDELPQLINVIKGEMSLIGPRPVRDVFAKEVAKEIPFYDLRFRVKPGLTGWAQVVEIAEGDVDNWYTKTKLDLYYVQFGTLALDFRIVVMTIRALLSKFG